MPAAGALIQRSRQLSHGLPRAVIVMIDTVGVLCVLPHHHHRNLCIFEELSVLCRDHCTDEDDSVHRIVFEQL